MTKYMFLYGATNLAGPKTHARTGTGVSLETDTKDTEPYAEDTTTNITFHVSQFMNIFFKEGFFGKRTHE